MRRTGVVTAVLVGVLAGCGAPVAGTPSAAPPTSASARDELPPRPREIPLDGLDPCTLITEQERAEFGLDQEPLLTQLPSMLYGGVTQLCTIGGFEPRAISVGIELSTTGGIELFFRPGVPSEIRPIEVQGFPAIVAVPTLERFCTVAVDVAPGQLLDLSASDGGRVPPIPQEDLCVDAQRLAGIVMGNLLSRS